MIEQLKTVSRFREISSNGGSDGTEGRSQSLESVDWLLGYGIEIPNVKEEREREIGSQPQLLGRFLSFV